MVSEYCPLSRGVLRPEQGLQTLPFSWLQTPDSPVFGSQVVMDEVLQRDSIKDNLEESPYYLGATFGSALWVAYAWITRLRHGVLPDTTTALFLLLLIRSIRCFQLSTYAHRISIIIWLFHPRDPLYNVP